MIARAEIQDAGDGVMIEVREPRSLFAIAFLLFWLCGWLVGEVLKVLAFRRTRSYDVGRIRDFRLSPESMVEAGAFRFDYGDETIAVLPHLNYA